LLALALCGVANAQPASPVPPGTLPVTPDPVECGIAPREAEGIVDLAATPAATPLSGTPTPDLAAGAPAGPATVAFVNAIVREAIACGNGAGFPGVAALLSDDALARDALAAGAALTFAPDAPPPTAEERRALVDLRDVRDEGDGRVAALVVVADPTRSPAETAYALVLAEGAAGTGGSEQYLYLIDALAPAANAPSVATPVASIHVL
jgi:hypothetical protein